ncbi:N-acyl-phosphatidylethanolamine-hydrolyzing phospholipase D [Biomphalaria pfeifferi]|uniref:N-acetylphosphatidylethanolamine-hydrolyzing phospholipase D n=1 Tax=Biomphalaria pfeifferi TaxID=112525 RepID=A0AAD8BZV1_BIOPF|nr:N-acyl-phosphatidylethanolamine-hydrolyzing phospholipase D [Biomphalaria pfeifferi]
MEVLVEETDIADKEPRGSHHILTADGRFSSSWDPWRKPSFASLLKFLFMRSEDSVPDSVSLEKTLPIIKADVSQFDKSPDSGIRHMWIGHATSLVQFDGVTLLTDPIFSNRCSPFQWLGTKRYRPPPLTIDQLPKIDCVLISHNHYDHLDINSVKALNERYGESLTWYVPLGLKQWMNDSGCSNVIELQWWQEHLHSPESQVKMVCTPCQHWCKRTLNDDNKVLWSSWCVLGPKHNFYFAGDTGYCNVFKEIGKKYGPFTLSTIPIGAYSPRWFLKHHHVDPSEAVDIHIDVKSKKSIGIHWGTFVLSKEFYLEPREKLKEELEKRGMTLSSFITVRHGDVLVTD